MLLALVPAAIGCGAHSGRVTVRVVDGRPQPTRFVSAHAYEAYLRAEVLLARGDRQAALRELRTAVALDPQSPYLRTQMASLLLADGKLAHAREQLGVALQLSPDFPDALLRLAALQLKQGQTDAALDTLRRAVKGNPEHEAARVSLAAVLENEGRAEQARAVLSEMVRQLPDSRAGHDALAVLCLRQVDYRCAARALARRLQLSTSLDTLIRLAHVEYAIGNAPSAVRLMREAFDRSGGDVRVAGLLAGLLAETKQPRAVDDLLEVLERAAGAKPEALVALAEVGLRGDRPKRVLEIIEAAIAARKGRPPGPLPLARAAALDQLGRFDQARKILQGALSGPYAARAAQTLAAIYSRRGQYQRASAALRQLSERADDDGQLTLALSQSLFAEGKRDASVRVVREAAAKRGGYRLQFAVGASLERAGRWREALAHMQRLLKDHPKDGALHNFVGYTMLIHGGSIEAAEKAIRRALYLLPGEGYIIDSLGWLYFKQGRLAEAEQTLTLAARLSPREPEVLFHLADVKVALKQLATALQLFERAVRLSKDAQLTARLRARIDQLKRSRVGRRK